jgi:cytochrome P450
VVIANGWALSHEESFFPNPEEFNPDRWIEHPTLPVSGWGFGKRICTERFIAMNFLYINTARILWAS